MAKTVKLTFGYGAEQESTRNYSLTVDDSLAAACKGKIKALNASLAAGSDDGLSDFFLSDNEEKFSRITYAEIESVETQVLDISGN